jgi:hypothetical protein
MTFVVHALASVFVAFLILLGVLTLIGKWWEKQS